MKTDRAVLLVLIATAHPPIRLSAQVSFHLAAGARYSSTLVHDSIVTPFDLRPAIAPTLALTVLEQTPGPWAPDLTLDISWGGLRRHDDGGASSRINSLATLAFTVGVRRQIRPSLHVRAGAGAIKYVPGDATGIFRDGSGIAGLGAAALEWAPPAAARRRLALTLRYDTHRFLTPALRSVGFPKPRLIHRVALGLRARIGGAP